MFSDRIICREKTFITASYNYTAALFYIQKSKEANKQKYLLHINIDILSISMREQFVTVFILSGL